MDIIISAFGAGVVVIFATMVALVFIQVIDRFVGIGWFWTEEMVRSMLIWCVMLGLPVVLYDHQEIVVDIISLSESADKKRLLIANLLSLLFLFILGWQGAIFTMKNANFTSPSLGVSRFWLYVPIPIGAFMGCLALIVRPLQGRETPIDEVIE